MEPTAISSRKPFRVIVVGAGVAGLSLSHALQLANIEHVVLEKHRDIVSLHGAALTIFPGAARILDQFGILKSIQDSVMPVQKEFIRWPDGSINTNPSNHPNMKSHFDIAPISFNRQRLVTHLYDGLPDKSMIRTNARVGRIEQNENGVKVVLADGSFEEGDLVIGADGVHSLTRQLMWDYATQTRSDSIPESDKKALFTEFKGIYGVSDLASLPSLGPAEMHICFGQDTTKLIFTQPGVAMWAIMYKDGYSQPPEPYRPDAKQREDVANRFMDLRITDKIAFKDLWESKSRCGILNIEEGVLDKWYAGRIVLVGDSAHKMTADIGIGANMAIESVVVLANVLQRSVAHNPDPNYHPTQAELSELFTQYQSTRYARVKQYMKLSGSITRMRSYQSIWKRIWISHIDTLPVMQRIGAKKLVAGLARAPKLEYVGTRTIDENAKGWHLGHEKDNQLSGGGWIPYVLVTSVVGMAISYAAVLSWGRPL